MSYLRQVVVPTLIIVVAVACAAAWLSGVSAGWSALGGGLVAAVLLASTPAVLAPVSAQLPEMSLPFAVIFYATKVTLIAAAFVAMSRSQLRDTVDLPWLAGAIISTTLVWTVQLIRAHLGDRRPLYDLS